MNEATYKGSCLCGVVQFEITGEPITMTYCHCESCRRWVGAPVMGGCLYKTDQVQIVKGEQSLSLFKRSEDSGSHRKFCQSCGSALFNEHPSIHLTDVMATSIENFAFKPKLHTNYAEKIISMYDGLPKYKDFDPLVGGSGELLPE